MFRTQGQRTNKIAPGARGLSLCERRPAHSEQLHRPGGGAVCGVRVVALAASIAAQQLVA